MKDLDFDELDRAVNSLMTNVPKTTNPPGEEKVKTLNITPTLDDNTEPQFDRVEKLASQVTDSKATATSAIPPLATPTIPARSNAPMQAPARPATPAARRGGRFMDVVHPSSDMNTKKPDAPVSRQGVTIEPRNTAPLIQEVSPVKPTSTPAPTVEAEEKSEPVKPTADETPTTPPAAVQPVETTALASDWPDPLDMAPHAPVNNDDPAKDKTVPEAKPDMPENTSDDLAAAPLTSPFLPDAKVEKRPLGGAPTPVADEPVSPPWEKPAKEEKEEEPKTVDDPNAQLPAEPEDVEPLLPEELGNDLMAVEADTTHDTLKEAHDAAKEEEETKPEEKPKAEKSKMRESAESVPTGPTSIPQQYHEEPSTGDQKNGSIYDTDTYHQPLAHPAKKKSGWMWVLWIVLILVVGAGAGAALYFSGVI